MFLLYIHTYVDEEITGGDVVVTAKLFSIPVLRSEYKVCDIVTGGCPFQGMFVTS